MKTTTTELVAIVDFESTCSPHPSVKARECWALFGFGFPRYYHHLYHALRDPAVEQARPLLVRRLRAERDGSAIRRASHLPRPDRRQKTLELKGGSA